MAGASDPFSILNKGGQDMRVSQYQKKQNVNRYWRGVAPETNDDEDEFNMFDEAPSFKEAEQSAKNQLKEIVNENKSNIQVDDIVKNQKEQEDEEEARKRVLGRRRQVQKSQVVSEQTEQQNEIADQQQKQNQEQVKQQSVPAQQKPAESAVTSNSQASLNNNVQITTHNINGDVKVEARNEGRAAAKARLLQRQKEEEELKKQKQLNKQQSEEMEIERRKSHQKKPNDDDSEDEEDEDSDKSSSENDSGDEEDDEDDEEEEEDEDEEVRPVYKMMKPVYIPKAERDYQNQLEKEEMELEEEEKRKDLIAKQQIKMIIMDQKKQQIIGNMDEEHSDDSRQGKDFMNDDDEMDVEFEREQWKIRELKRIRKDREEQIKREKEIADAERRSKMTNEEIIEEDKKLGLHQKQEKRQYSFMQKYYHKGAFYQDDDEELMQRDFNMPVGEELVDKSVMPSIMQKRRGNYSKKGQSKYTHLTDQDTTNYDPKYKVDETLQKKMFSKQAGLKASNNVDPRKKKY